MQPEFISDKIYHIYNRGNNYEEIFYEERNYSYFLRLVERYILPIAIVYAYCLIPNHFHLVLKFRKTDGLPEKYRTGNRKIYHAFSDMFNAYVKSINKAYGRRGSLFQKVLKRKVISDDYQLREVIRYVHRNPIKHGLKDNVSDYVHSSYNDIVNRRTGIVSFFESIELFDDLENFIYCHHEKDLQGLEDLEDLK